MKILNKLIEKEDLEKLIELRNNFIKSAIKSSNKKERDEYEIRLSELKNVKDWLDIQQE